MEGTLATLPLEIVARIISCFETARTLIYFSLACRRIYDYVERDGFRIFVQTCFPSIKTPPNWKPAAHAMTTLSRNWDRRAFVARYLVPRFRNTPPRRRDQRGHSPERPPGAQTIAYRPVIDSYEEWMGGTWASRKQILAWGAGPELIIRSKYMGDMAKKHPEDELDVRRTDNCFAPHAQISIWTSYKANGQLEGRDDITCLNLLPSLNNSTEDEESIVVGRASGALTLLNVGTLHLQSHIVTEFDTAQRPVRLATANEASKPLLAVCLSNRSLALYSVGANDRTTKPSDETLISLPNQQGKTWSTKFLRSDRLAVGVGPSDEPIQVYSIEPDGLSEYPLRRFGCDSIVTTAANGTSVTSVYSLAPIATSSSAGGAEGDLFLSGAHDGNTRLHDFRCPAPSVAVYTDGMDVSSFGYSVVPFGRERFIVGSSQNAVIKIFDLRMPGGKVYFAPDVDRCCINFPHAPPSKEKGSANYKYDYGCEMKYRDCSIFLQPSRRGQANARRRTASPVYSLSSPSPCSPTFFAGIEGKVLEIDVVSVMDRHPDTIFGKGSERVGGSILDVRRKWDPLSNVLCLPMFEEVGSNICIRTQRPVGVMGTSPRGRDERWPE